MTVFRNGTTGNTRPAARGARTPRTGRAGRTWRERTRRAGGGPVARRPAPSAAARPADASKPGFLSRTDWGRVRLWTVGVFFVAIWGALWARAYYLQMVMGPEYAAMARKQHTTKETVRGMRGRITDRNGNVLAMSLECDSVRADPSRIQDKNDTALKLAAALDMNADKILNAVNGGKQFAWLKRKADFQTAEKVRALKLPGIYLEQETERVYPYRQLAGQLLGFVDTDDRGIEGLEKSLDDELAGRAVTMTVERDASGRRLTMPGSADLVDLRGSDIRLTLDTQIQFFAEEALAEQVEKFGARWGGCIVADVPSGEILAWAQYPFFDPNNVNASPPAVRRNRPATDMLEQGSTIKSFLIAAALEEKVVAPSTTVNCEKGMWKLGRFMLHDTHPYGNLSVERILHVSSNIGAAKIGLKLGKDKYHRYLKRLGFGERTGLPLPGESRGILRPAGRWAEIDLATASFGQSFSATLAQMAKAYLVLAGGGVKRDLKLLMDDGPEALPDKVASGQDAARASYNAESAADRERATGNAAAGQGAERASYNAESGQAAGRVSYNAAAEQDAERAGGSVPAGAARADDLIFSPSTMKEIRNMLREVVEEEGGTGKQARIPGLVVGGKTGTSQKADATGKYGKGRVGSFVGMLPIENPRYLICVLLDEPTRAQYGGVIAAPVFRHVAMNTMAYHGILPSDEAPALQAASSGEADRRAAGGKAAAGGKNGRGTKKREAPEQAQSRTQPQAKSQMQPQAQPQAQPRALIPDQPRAQSRSRPLLRPQVQPDAQPRAQPRTRPQAQPQVQPQAQPRTQPLGQPPVQPQAQGKEQRRS
ncbi:MAG: penicillin-binding protein [Desulfovibrio sp.]|jgi:cell division protein FtsI (penicillin-binding protein 3)|nr:penicillin-binding protein [Desulfovibrio sp.]